MRERGDDVVWVGKALTAVGRRGFGRCLGQCRRSAESGVDGGVGGGAAWGR